MQTTPGAPLSSRAEHTQTTRRRTATLLAIAAAILALDQLTKVWAVTALSGGRVVDVVGEFLQFRLVRNPGAAFSLFTEHTAVLTVIAVAVVVVILWVSRNVTSPVWAVALGGLLGGAAGTLTDRLFREPGFMQGHVVDFLELPNWPVFNVADSAIVGSAVLIALLSFRGVPYSVVATDSEATSGRLDDTGSGDMCTDGAASDGTVLDGPGPDEAGDDPDKPVVGDESPADGPDRREGGHHAGDDARRVSGEAEDGNGAR